MYKRCFHFKKIILICPTKINIVTCFKKFRDFFFVGEGIASCLDHEELNKRKTLLATTKEFNSFNRPKIVFEDVSNDCLTLLIKITDPYFPN